MSTRSRPVVSGKLLALDHRPFFVRGVTYGPFRPQNGSEYHDEAVVAEDFACMAQHGVNAVRTYTAPPPWFLDLAQQHGFYVMLGLPWEQHIAFLDDAHTAKGIAQRVRQQVHTVAGHPAILCYTVGNEIPAPVVRWHGRRPVEAFLARLVDEVKSEDCGALVTYVNYPTTEYLRLPDVDFFCYNVYLERQDRLDAYLARLQNIAGNRPLLLAEIGLDSQRNGEEQQAAVLDWQLRTIYQAGAAGAFVFAWTDEWHRGGHDIEDWDFGLTRRDRSAKPALQTVADVFAEVPLPPASAWPSITVVVCSHNGAQAIGQCCSALRDLCYPHYDVIVVDDGSTDETAAIARGYGFRVISIESQGLSGARNVGLAAATGEIVAYTDDDAYPHPLWLRYLAATFMHADFAAVGGPNIPPAGDGLVADCVANAPGGPIHVLITDRDAEHIPGCNMAFRRERLLAIGGFDPRFRAAGDDVDACWRVLGHGGRIGFSPAAMVWHHRRDSVKAYWKQQLGYGKAEALLEMKWPQRYNSFGHISWQGRLYGAGLTRALLPRRWRIYHGVWGSQPFQGLYERQPGRLASMPLMPEWYLIVAGLLALSLLGAAWPPLLLAWPLLALAVGAAVAQAMISAREAQFADPPRTVAARVQRYGLTAALHLLQPLARLLGRLRYGLTPWRRRGAPVARFPRRASYALWDERWHSSEQRLEAIEGELQAGGAVVARGGDFDTWDLEVRGGLFGAVRSRLAIEEHGGGRQLVRVRTWPRITGPALALTVVLALLALAALGDGALIAGVTLGVSSFLVALRAFGDCAVAAAAMHEAVAGQGVPVAKPGTR